MRYTPYLTIFALAAACGHSATTSTSSSGGGTVAGKPTGVDIAAMAQREVTDLAPVHVAAPDRSVDLTVDAKGEPKLTKLQDGTTVLIVPIGTREPIQCIVGSAPDLASGQLLQRKGVEKFDEREIVDIDAGELGGAAFLATRTLYIFDDHGQRTVGEIKTAAAHKGVNVGAACVHDEVGYGQTLRRVLKSIVESIKIANEKAQPLYRDIGVITLKNKPIGVIELTVMPTADGKLWTFESSSMMLPTTAKDLSGQDEYSAEMSSSGGDVEKGIYVAMQGAGETHFEINLEREKAGYHAKGKFQGKDIDTKIAAKGGLPSSLRTAQLTRELVAGKRRELVLTRYSPGSDPTALGTRKVTASGDKALPYKEQEGEVAALSDYDENGRTRKGRLSVGPLALDFTRVAQYGRWPRTGGARKPQPQPAE